MKKIQLAMTGYLKQWWTIMLRPIYFFTKLKDENWQEEPLTFLLLTSWILAFFSSLLVFIIQYIPIGSTLLEKVVGLKTIIIIPTLVTLAFVFFMITFLIIGGVFTALLFIFTYFSAYLLHFVYTRMGAKGKLSRLLQCLCYACAPLLSLLLIVVLALLVKLAQLDFALFRVGYNFYYFLLMIYLYGMWAIVARKTYGVSKAKAFQGALVLFIALLIFGFIFDKIALCKIQPWIS